MVIGKKSLLDRRHDRYDSAILVKSNITKISAVMISKNDIEISSVTAKAAFSFNFYSQPTKIPNESFNCYTSTWKYTETDANSEEREE